MTDQYIITSQTFYDLSTWLIQPEKHTDEQLARLKNEDECLPLLSLAHQYWLTAALTEKLKHSKIWDLLSANFKSYLLDIEKIYLNRVTAIKEEAIFVSELLAEANISIVIMKGAASLFNGVAEPISNRYMKDIDILVPEEYQQKSCEVLKAYGYIKDPTYFNVNAKDAHHAPPLIKNNLCYIELHRWVVVKHLKKMLNTEDIWKASIPLTLNKKLIVNQLCPTHQVILSIVHSEIQNGGYDQKHIDLHQLFNLYSITTHFSDKINWDIVQEHFESTNQEAILITTLFIMNKLFHLSTPITEQQNLQAKKHFEKCMNRYEINQGVNSGFSVIMEQLYEYKRRNVELRYGKEGDFSYILGVIKQMAFHARKIFSLNHTKLYLRRVFNNN